MQWLIVRYAQQNMEQIIEAIRIAKQEGLSVSLDLASFEVCMHLYYWPYCSVEVNFVNTVSCFFVTGYMQMVRDSRSKLINLLETGNIDLCFANEDEAREVIGWVFKIVY